MYFVDCHCHIDLFPNMQDAINKSEHNNIYTIAVTTTPRAWPRNAEMTKNTRHVRAALGIHPQLIAQKTNELELFKKYIRETKYIGEVGLDGTSQSKSSLDRQCEIFSEILDCCSTLGGRILSIHSRRASKEALDIVEKKLPMQKNVIILHWFSGNKSDTRRAIDLGCYFSINSKMISSKNSMQLISYLPSERILTETDFPFTCDDQLFDQPSNIKNCIEQLSQLYNRKFDAMKKIVWDNFCSLLSGNIM